MEKPVSVACLLLILTTLAVSCGKKDAESGPDAEETGQQIGDVMASIDESGGDTSGSIALLEQGANRTFARLAPRELREPWLSSLLLPNAFAAGLCSSKTFDPCSGGVMVRNFDSCTVGLSTITGVVTLTKSGGCVALAPGASITRVPAFLITGPRGGTYAVTKTGSIGQRLTLTTTPGTFTFSNDGINRKFTASGGSVLFDFTTRTGTDLTFTGTNRLNRTLVSGNIEVTDNLKGVTCSFTPSNVVWAGTCNCPKSGSWSGNCGESSASLTLTGCGTATVTVGSETKDITFDRCYGS